MNHSDRARKWWNDQDYRAKPEEIITSLAAEFGEVFEETVISEGKRYAEMQRLTEDRIAQLEAVVERLTQERDDYARGNAVGVCVRADMLDILQHCGIEPHSPVSSSEDALAIKRYVTGLLDTLRALNKQTSEETVVHHGSSLGDRGASKTLPSVEQPSRRAEAPESTATIYDGYQAALDAGDELRCGKYLGDNDATCPQLTCIRKRGHDGLCDNVRDDGPQVGAEVFKVTRGAGNPEIVGSIPTGSESGSSVCEDDAPEEMGMTEAQLREMYSDSAIYDDHEAAPMGARVNWGGGRILIKGRCTPEHPFSETMVQCLGCERLGYHLAKPEGER